MDGINSSNAIKVVALVWQTYGWTYRLEKIFIMLFRELWTDMFDVLVFIECRYYISKMLYFIFWRIKLLESNLHIEMYSDISFHKISIYLSIYLFIYLSIYLSVYLAINIVKVNSQIRYEFYIFIETLQIVSSMCSL